MLSVSFVYVLGGAGVGVVPSLAPVLPSMPVVLLVFAMVVRDARVVGMIGSLCAAYVGTGAGFDASLGLRVNVAAGDRGGVGLVAGVVGVGGGNCGAPDGASGDGNGGLPVVVEAAAVTGAAGVDGYDRSSGCGDGCLSWC